MPRISGESDIPLASPTSPKSRAQWDAHRLKSGPAESLLRDRSDEELQELAAELNRLSDSPQGHSQLLELNSAIDYCDYERPIWANRSEASYLNLLLLLNGEITQQQWATVQEFLKLKEDEAKGLLKDVEVIKITTPTGQVVPEMREELQQHFFPSLLDQVDSVWDTLDQLPASDQIIFRYKVPPEALSTERMLRYGAGGLSMIHNLEAPGSDEPMFSRPSLALVERIDQALLGSDTVSPRYAIGNSVIEDILRDAQDDMRVIQVWFPGFDLPLHADNIACPTGEDFLLHDLTHAHECSYAPRQIRAIFAYLALEMHNLKAEELRNVLIDMPFSTMVNFVDPFGTEPLRLSWSDNGDIATKLWTLLDDLFCSYGNDLPSQWDQVAFADRVAKAIVSLSAPGGDSGLDLTSAYQPVSDIVADIKRRT